MTACIKFCVKRFCIFPQSQSRISQPASWNCIICFKVRVDGFILCNDWFCTLLTIISIWIQREYLDNVPLFQGCDEKFLDAVSVLLREVQVSAIYNLEPNSTNHGPHTCQQLLVLILACLPPIPPSVNPHSHNHHQDFIRVGLHKSVTSKLITGSQNPY